MEKAFINRASEKKKQCNRKRDPKVIGHDYFFYFSLTMIGVSVGVLIAKFVLE